MGETPLSFAPCFDAGKRVDRDGGGGGAEPKGMSKPASPSVPMPRFLKGSMLRCAALTLVHVIIAKACELYFDLTYFASFAYPDMHYQLSQ